MFVPWKKSVPAVRPCSDEWAAANWFAGQTMVKSVCPEGVESKGSEGVLINAEVDAMIVLSVTGT